MEDKDVINHRLEVLESTAQQMYEEKKIMRGQINALNETVNILRAAYLKLEQKVRANETK